MNSLQQEVTVTALENTAVPASGAVPQPEADGIVVRAEPQLDSAMDSAQVHQFLTRALPVAVSVTVPYSLAPLSIAPDNLTVTHQYSGPHRRFARLEEDGVADVLVTQQGGFTTVKVLARDHATASALWDVVRTRVSAQMSESDVTRCQLWTTASYGPSSRDHKVRSSRWTDVRRNYAAVAARQLDELMALQDPDDDGGRLVLWHGQPGTGKTSAVRTLITEWLPWCDAHLVTDPERFFTSPDYLLEVVEEPARPDFREPLRGLDELAPSRWKVIICEDADEYLRSDARERSGPALGRLLNLTDGILGEGAKTMVLLTTNDDLGRIHTAVQRPGRCRATVEFPALSAAEAAAWCPPGITPPTSPATLAELFGLTRGREVSEPEPSAGLYL
ncbi:ATP-binding protein [Marmoricola sp. OAE513]|uniref:AAA family ATPase n=1 Tax=Marmoricola sp. OAE513 TaxID=2817894 RepID=UPI001AE5E5B4